MKKTFLLIFICISLSLMAQIERRAAFDIGSGAIKMQVSDVDTDTNQIVNTLIAANAHVGLRDDLAKNLDGNLSKAIERQAIETILSLKAKAEPYHPEVYHAIATETLRLAKNSDEWVDRIKKETGVAVTIISQKEEGILGFISALSQSGVHPDDAVSWDFGGGSFQITTRSGDHYEVYQGRLGRIPLKNAVLKIQGKELSLSPNPISQSDMDEAVAYIKEVIQDIPEALLRKIEKGHVLGIGIHPLWGMPDNAFYDMTRISQEINCRIGLSDEEIRAMYSFPVQTTCMLSNLIFAYGVMEAMNISQVHYVGTLGANAIGALISPQYWGKK